MARSHSLLTAPEQRLFRRLAVFAEGGTAESPRLARRRWRSKPGDWAWASSSGNGARFVGAGRPDSLGTLGIGIGLLVCGVVAHTGCPIPSPRRQPSDLRRGQGGAQPGVEAVHGAQVAVGAARRGRPGKDPACLLGDMGYSRR